MADTYIPAGTHNDGTIKNAAAGGDTIAMNFQYIIDDAQSNWKKAYEAGDQKGMNYWHDVAEAARAKYGYSGGADGTDYIPLSSNEAPFDDTPGGSGGSSGGSGNSYKNPSDYKAYVYPTATSAEDYIREIYAAQQEDSLSALKSAYEQNVLELDSASAKIPGQYTSARNSASTASEINRAAFNEYAAANGLGSGTGGQAQLSMSNALLGNLSTISKAEADTLSELELQRASLRTSYNNNIQAAIAKGKYELANALYAEMVRLDEANLAIASLQANENYRAHSINK